MAKRKTTTTHSVHRKKKTNRKISSRNFRTGKGSRSNFRRGVRFEHRARDEMHKEYPYVERSYASLGPADLWCIRPITITKDMIGETVCDLTLVLYHTVDDARRKLLEKQTGGKVLFCQGANTKLEYRTAIYGCIPVKLTQSMIGETFSDICIVQCKSNSNKSYFTYDERAMFLYLKKATGARRALLITKDKDRGPLIIKDVQ